MLLSWPVFNASPKLELADDFGGVSRGAAFDRANVRLPAVSWRQETRPFLLAPGIGAHIVASVSMPVGIELTWDATRFAFLRWLSAYQYVVLAMNARFDLDAQSHRIKVERSEDDSS
jgi:hypothetical protein